MKNSKVQIVATIGLATKDKETIKKMIDNHMDVARLNFSWGTYEEHANYIKIIRELGNIPIIQDLSGPRIQEGKSHHFDENEEIITEKDLKDLEFGIEQKVDYVAMSFVGTAKDVLKLKKYSKGIPIIAKIERKIAVENIDEILKVTDGIMIARGDLGNEVPLEEIPFIEKNIIAKCKEVGKPVVVATQMMLSMTENKTPTRAEVTDVAYAVSLGADAVMLSEETASGQHPVGVIEMMEKINLEAEKHYQNIIINPLKVS
ncbi:MAG: pyruvate kinase [Patescibacteria group bacterium]|nr:pyruvate kinase [Patescibacteria group bacterium]